MEMKQGCKPMADAQNLVDIFDKFFNLHMPQFPCLWKGCLHLFQLLQVLLNCKPQDVGGPRLLWPKKFWKLPPFKDYKKSFRKLICFKVNMVFLRLI